MAVSVTTPTGDAEEQLSPDEERELAAVHRAEWLRLDAEIKEADNHLRRTIAVQILTHLKKTAEKRIRRRLAAKCLAASYEDLHHHFGQEGVPTVKLPGDGTIRIQRAGGRPKIVVEDEELAIKWIRRLRWAKAFLKREVSLNKRRLQEHPDQVAKIKGLRVEEPQAGFFIDGRKINLETGEAA